MRQFSFLSSLAVLLLSATVSLSAYGQGVLPFSPNFNSIIGSESVDVPGYEGVALYGAFQSAAELQTHYLVFGDLNDPDNEYGRTLYNLYLGAFEASQVSFGLSVYSDWKNGNRFLIKQVTVHLTPVQSYMDIHHVSKAVYIGGTIALKVYDAHGENAQDIQIPYTAGTKQKLVIRAPEGYYFTNINLFSTGVSNPIPDLWETNGSPDLLVSSLSVDEIYDPRSTQPTPTPTPSPTPSGPLSKPTDVPPPSGETTTDPAKDICSKNASGSIIHVDNRSLGEVVDVVGAPFSLYYFSDRMRSGVGGSNTIHIPLVPSSPVGMAGVVLNIQYGNRTFNQFFPPVPGLSYDFAWDGKDENGNPISGQLPAHIAVVYLLIDGTAPYTLSTVTLGGSGSPRVEAGLGGWTPSNHHSLDVASKTIHYGYGISWPVEAMPYGNRILVASSDGAEAYLFDLNGRHLETRDALTNALKTQFSYSTDGLLISETDAFGNKTLINHNGSIPTSIVSPYGQVTQLSVDQNGYLSRITNPAGNTYQMSYSANGLLQTFTKPNGHTSQMTYDSQGKLVKDLGAGGDSSTLSESVANGIKTIQKLTSMNRETLYTSSDDGTNSSRSTRLPSGEITAAINSTYTSQTTTPHNLVIQSTSIDDERFGSMAPIIASVQSSIVGSSFVSNLASTQSVSTKNGDVLSIDQLVHSTTINSDPRQTYQSKYDGSTRTISTVTPEGQTSKAIYNQIGQLVSAQIGQLTPSLNSYDSRGRLIGVSRGSRKTLFIYDTQGNISTIQNPLNLKTSMNYDAAGRVIQETRPDGKSVRYSYDALGNLISLTPANNFAHQFAVNLADDPSGYLPPKVGGVSTGATLYSYNLDRQLIRVSQPDGSSINYSYDLASGQLMSIAGNKRSVSLSYDPNTKQLASLQTSEGIATDFEYIGPLKTKELTSSALGSHSINLEYANNMTLSGLSLNSGAGLERAVGIAYDRDQRPIQIGDERFVIDSQSGLLKSSSLGVVSQNLNYNSFGEQTVDTYKVGSKQIYSAEMVRNALGQITQRTEVVNGKKVRFDFAYDNLSRLTSVKTNGLPVLSYSYDANGNRVSAGALFGLIKIKEKYDEQDRLISMGDVTYSYDAMGNRIKKSIPVNKKKSNDTLYSYNSFGQLKSVTLPNGKQIEYLIDGLGRRIGKKVNGKIVQGFIYQSQTQIAAETDGKGVIIRRFVYGTKSNVPDYMITKDGAFRLITDQVGTLRMIVDVSKGKIIDESLSTPFGEITLDCKRFLTPFGFAGGLYDRDTGLVHFGAREYDPQVGRWISKDSIGFNGGDMNLYGYVLNDPINAKDSLGLSAGPAASGEGISTNEGIDLLIQSYLNEHRGCVEAAYNHVLSDRISGAASGTAIAAADHYLNARHASAQPTLGLPTAVSLITIGIPMYQIGKTIDQVLGTEIFSNSDATKPNTQQEYWGAKGVIDGILDRIR